MKRCGKSAPDPGVNRGAGKPLPEQSQIEGWLRFVVERRPTVSPGRLQDPSGNGRARQMTTISIRRGTESGLQVLLAVSCRRRH